MLSHTLPVSFPTVVFTVRDSCEGAEPNKKKQAKRRERKTTTTCRWLLCAVVRSGTVRTIVCVYVKGVFSVFRW